MPLGMRSRQVRTMAKQKSERRRDLDSSKGENLSVTVGRIQCCYANLKARLEPDCPDIAYDRIFAVGPLRSSAARASHSLARSFRTRKVTPGIPLVHEDLSCKRKLLLLDIQWAGLCSTSRPQKHTYSDTITTSQKEIPDVGWAETLSAITAKNSGLANGVFLSAEDSVPANLAASSESTSSRISTTGNGPFPFPRCLASDRKGDRCQRQTRIRVE